MVKNEKSNNKMSKLLDSVERLGNRIPNQAMLFIYLSIGVLVLSAILSTFGVTVKMDIGVFPINNLLGQKPFEVPKFTPSGATISETYSNGLSYIMSTAINNFKNFKIISILVAIFISIGVMENSGYLGMTMNRVVKRTPAHLITPVVVFLGCMSNIAGDTGYVVLIPLAAFMFYSVGRNPITGIVAGYAGVSGGFSANLLISGLDATLFPFTLAGAKLGDALLNTNTADNFAITSNWFFLIASTILVTVVGTLVIDKVVDPRLGVYDKSEADIVEKIGEVTGKEKKAFKLANISLLIVVIGIVLTALPIDVNNVIPLIGDLSVTVPKTFVNSEGTVGFSYASGILKTLFFNGDVIIMIMFTIFLVPGIVYGFSSGNFKSKDDMIDAMTKSVKSLSYVIVVLFIIIQFINYLFDSGIGMLLASYGAALIKIIPADNVFMSIILMIMFIFIMSLVNIFIIGATYKWGLFSQIMVPVMMVAGFSPAGVQLMYRIADSSTNIITPLMSYLPIIVGFGLKYKKDFSIGKLISAMFPISMALLICWTVFAVVWMLLGLPIGPNEFFLM